MSKIIIWDAKNHFKQFDRLNRIIHLLLNLKTSSHPMCSKSNNSVRFQRAAVSFFVTRDEMYYINTFLYRILVSHSQPYQKSLSMNWNRTDGLEAIHNILLPVPPNRYARELVCLFLCLSLFRFLSSFYLPRRLEHKKSTAANKWTKKLHIVIGTGIGRRSYWTRKSTNNVCGWQFTCN